MLASFIYLMLSKLHHKKEDSECLLMLLTVVVVYVLGTTEFSAFSFPFPYYYKSGDNIALSCRVPSNYMFQFWTLPSMENISTTSGRHHIMTVASTVTLFITNSTSSDNGAYMCNACKISCL